MKPGKEEHVDTGDELLTSIVRHVDARPKPPVDIEKAVYQHTLEDWKQLVVNRKRKKMVISWSVAASVLMALLISPLMFQSQSMIGSSESLGMIENQRGSVSVTKGDQHVQPGSAEKANLLFPGQSILTAANSGASINWGKGNTVRVDQNTELDLLSKTKIELVSGKIYVDIPHVSGQIPSDVELTVLTKFGLVNHVGTQFIVSSDTSHVEVKVREGAVSIDNKRQVFVTEKGQQTTLGESDQVSHEAILTYGPDWQWAEQLTPGFVLEGKTLDDFLTWVGRESGREILFDTKAAQDIASHTIMHGSVGAEPLTALELVLQTNALSWSIQDGTIHLFVSQ